MALGWFYSPAQIGRYCISRHTTLKPPRTNVKDPITVLRQLDKHQWVCFQTKPVDDDRIDVEQQNMFMVGFIGWTWDSFDFFTVSLTVTELAQQFEVENSEVTWVRFSEVPRWQSS